jgi:hypothetical protein
MKFANFSKLALFSLLAGVLALALAGCGASNNLALSQGNWSMTATPSGGGTFYIGGNLTQNGGSLAGTMYVVSSGCYSSSQTVTFTGTVKGTKVTLTSASVGGEVITIAATGTSGSALTGTYTIAGGTTCNGETGTLTANPVPSIGASWSGPILNDAFGDPNVTFSVALTQAHSASSDGTFALTGNITFTGSSCSVSGTLNSAFIAGPYLLINGSTLETDNSTGDFSYQQVLLNNSSTPTSMTGTYQVNSGLCANDLTSATFTKQ